MKTLASKSLASLLFGFRRTTWRSEYAAPLRSPDFRCRSASSIRKSAPRVVPCRLSTRQTIGRSDAHFTSRRTRRAAPSRQASGRGKATEEGGDAGAARKHAHPAHRHAQHTPPLVAPTQTRSPGRHHIRHIKSAPLSSVSTAIISLLSPVSAAIISLLSSSVQSSIPTIICLSNPLS